MSVYLHYEVRTYGHGLDSHRKLCGLGLFVCGFVRNKWVWFHKRLYCE